MPNNDETPVTVTTPANEQSNHEIDQEPGEDNDLIENEENNQNDTAPLERNSDATNEDEGTNESNNDLITSQETQTPSRYVISMEIPFFLMMISIFLTGTAVSNLLLYRSCVYGLNHTKEECQDFLVPDQTMNISKSLEDEVELYKTNVSTSALVLSAIFPAILSLFVGSWSNVYGRKPLVSWPLLGMTFSTTLNVVFAIIENLGPWWYVLTIVPLACSGGLTVLYIGGFTYISDITSLETRSLRMTILILSSYTGSVIGSFSSSYILKEVGTTYLLATSALIQFVAFIFTHLILPESLYGALTGGYTKIFNFALAKDMLNTCFKHRPHNGRALIMLLCLSNTLASFILYGITDLSYLFTRTQLEWSLKQFTIYTGLDTIFSILMAFGIIKKIVEKYEIGDLTLTIISFISVTLGYLTLAFCDKVWIIWFALVVSGMKLVWPPLIRAHVSKFVPPEDIASVMTLLCGLESLCPLIAPIVFTSVYKISISVFPGTIYILAAFIAVLCTIFMSFVKYNSWQSSTETLPVGNVDN